MHRPNPLGAVAGTLTLCAVAYRAMFSASLAGFFGNGLADLVVFAAVALYLVSLLRSGAPPLKVNLAAGAFLLFALAYLITAKTSYYPRAAVDALMNLVALACLFVLVSGCLFSQQDAPWAASYIVALLALPLAIGSFQYVYEFPQMLKEGLNLPGWVGHVYVDSRSAADFMTRIQTMRVFATFFTPNVFAGYLVLMIPVTLGLGAAILRGAASRRGKAAAAAASAALALAQSVLLVLTKSKAGVAAAALAMVILVLLVLYRLISRRAFVVVLASLLVAGSIGALLFLSQARQFYNEALTSLEVRMGYWRTAWRIIRADPFSGIGPGNFGETYVAYKDIGEREVRDPHNAYLLTWVEGGFFSLLFFASFWVLVFAAPGEKASPGRSPPASAAVLAVLAALALYLVLQADLSGPDLELTAAVVAGTVVCLFLLLLFLPASLSADAPLARAGLAAGVAGFMIHCATDVDFSDAGAATAVIFAAAALSPRGKAAVLAAGRPPAAVLALSACLALLLFVGRTYIRYSQAEFALEEARVRLMEGNGMAAADRGRTAAALDPSNTAPVMFLAELYARSVPPGKPGSSNFIVAETFYRKALELNLRHWPAHDGLARLYETAGPDFTDKALSEYAALVAMYPVNSRYRLRAARLLEKSRYYFDALEHYRRARDIDDETLEHGQQLESAEKAEIKEAIERLKALLKPQGAKT